MSGNTDGDFPVSEQAAGEVISLPMHSELTEEQLVHIADAVKSFYTGA
jgi:dTDP-4-amino-4,6-dideoxygalactose transaminase